MLEGAPAGTRTPSVASASKGSRWVPPVPCMCHGTGVRDASDATSQGTTVGPFSAPPPLNVRQPNVARVYDRLLGGKDNFQADRDAADQLQKLLPDVAKAARENRYFLERVVRYLVGQAGIRQIIDIGTGLPTQDNVHEVAQRIAPETRVVYVDNDPMVVRHGLALLATNGNVAMVEADLRAPREITTHPDTRRLIDFSGPVAVLMLASLHFVTDAEHPQAIVSEWRDTMAPGSYLAISHITADEVEPATAKAAQAVYADASAPAVPRAG